ncbi:M4 family metallopeptidase [Streptomyces sp. KL116D]|uniref:M4 family metallopeptidase n=1 Tax=Streptomyces sp. KL116D TaxID=3045152 RepID=UPI003558E55D
MAELDDLHGDGKPIRYMDRPSKAGISSVGHAPFGLLDAAGEGAGAAHGGRGWATTSSTHCRGQRTEDHQRRGLRQPHVRRAHRGGRRTDRTPSAVVCRALTVYMTSTTDYAGARTATLQAAADLYGAKSDAYESVANAWAAVNVGIRYVNHIAAEPLPTEPVAVGQPVSRQITASSSRPGPLTYSAKSLPQGAVDQPHHRSDHRHARQGR